MIRRALAALTLLAVVAVLGCKSTPSLGAAARPLLWSAQKDGRTTYLLGTMHMGFNAEKQLPRWVWDKLTSATALAVETDITDPKLMTAGVRRDGTSLRDELGEEHWKKLIAALGPGNAAENLTPASAVTLLQAKEMPAAMPMDLMLLGEAESAKKKIVYLEDGLLQISLVSKWMDVRALKAALDQLDKGKKATKELLQAYIAGDPARIEAAVAESRVDFKASGRSDAEYDQMMEELLYKRNASWIDAIDELHRADSAIVAVGAAHLIGKRSVLELLAARGYKITRVTGP
ncbi:MAG: TraB/GumN family protein [Myxococcales bacterium]|nr:TraB/GumN family protein [Myxococcales bacterium]HRC58269.1 TraB/GumN family protein [Kofleriaceae bacterium]